MNPFRSPLPHLLLAGALTASVACDHEYQPLMDVIGPLAGAQIVAETNLRVTVNQAGYDYLSDSGGLDRIDFLLDGQLLCSDTEAPFLCNWIPTPDQNGGHSWKARAIAVDGKFAETAPQGINVNVAAAEPAEPGLIGFLPGLGGAQDIHVEGGQAFVASDAFGVSVIDGASSSVPRVTAASDEVFAGERLAISGTRAVATGVAEDGTSALWVLDVPAGGWPNLVGVLTSSLVPTSTTGFHDVALTASGSHAVVAAGSDGVWLVDLSDPTSPSVTGSWQGLEWNAWALGIAVQGNHAFVANGGRGLAVLSLANPAQPALVGSRMLSGTQQGVAVSGTRAYVASQTGSLRVIDIGNPASPVWLGTGTMSGVGQQVSAQGTQVATLAAGSGAILDLFDASNPASPVRTGSVVVGSVDQARGLTLDGGRVYVAAGEAGVQIYDANLGMTGHVEDRFAGEQMAAGDGLVVVVGTDMVSGNAHLQVIDLANPAEPAVVGELATSIVPGSVTGFLDVAVDRTRNLALVGAGADGAWIVDIANPLSPVLVGSFDTSGWVMGVDLDPSGTRAYLADGNGGLKILDLTNPASPQLLGSLGFSGTQRDVAVSGDHAYVVNQGGTMRVVDVANPASPRWVGSTSLGGFGFHIALDGGLAVVHSGNSTSDFLDVLDLSNPTRPTRVATVTVAENGGAGGIGLSGDRAAVAAGDAGLLIYDLSDPANPVLSSSGENVGAANDAVVESDTVCTTGFPATVSIIQL